MISRAGVVLLLAAYAMLWPGLTEPMLTLSGTVEKVKLVEIGRDILRESQNTSGLVRGLAERFLSGLDVDGTVSAFDKRNSILGTARELWNGGNVLVAVLIVSFSVIVPALKALLMLAALAPIRPDFKRPLQSLAAASGKWSMADVFVIAIFIAFLAGAGLSETSGLVEFQASLDSGFWWFLAYCLTSMVATQLIHAGRQSPTSARPARAAVTPRLPGSGAMKPLARRVPSSKKKSTAARKQTPARSRS